MNDDDDADPDYQCHEEDEEEDDEEDDYEEDLNNIDEDPIMNDQESNYYNIYIFYGRYQQSKHIYSRSTPSVLPSVTKFCVICNSKSIKSTSFKLQLNWKIFIEHNQSGILPYKEITDPYFLSIFGSRKYVKKQKERYKKVMKPTDIYKFYVIT